MSRWINVIWALAAGGSIAIILCVCASLVLIRNNPTRRLISDIQSNGGEPAIDDDDDAPQWYPAWMDRTAYSRVYLVKFSGAHFDDKALANLAPRMGEVESLHIEASGLTDDGLSHLTKMPRLSTLHLSGPHVTGRGLVHVAQLTKLRNLSLHDLDASANDLASLVQAKKLKTLSLRQMDVRGALAPLAGKQKLFRLSLNNASLDESDMQHIFAIPRLQELELKYCEVTDEYVAGLVGLRHLDKLSLDGARLTDASIPHLAQLTSLTHLGLTSTDVRGSNLHELEALDRLHQINLDGTLVGDDEVRKLATFKQLMAIHLTGSNVTPEGRDWLQQQLPHASIVY